MAANNNNQEHSSGSNTKNKRVPVKNEKYGGYNINVRNDRDAGCDIELNYDTRGDRKNPAMLLVMGVSAQRLFWCDEILDELAKKFFVIWFENRDIAGSTHMDHLGTQSLCCLVCCGGESNSCAPAPSYTLEDMAADAIALADALELDEFHLCGQSMGGFLAQLIAARLGSERVKSLTLIYTSPGDPSLPQPALSTMMAMSTTPKDDSRAAYIENLLKMAKGANFVPECVWDDAWLRQFYGRLYDRSQYMGMVLRQASACVRQRDRSALCKKLTMPTVVVHGELDILVWPAHGEALLRLIPNSRKCFLKNMGHGIMPVHAPEITQAMAEVAGLAAAAAAAPAAAVAPDAKEAAVAAAAAKPEAAEGQAEAEAMKSEPTASS